MRAARFSVIAAAVLSAMVIGVPAAHAGGTTTVPASDSSGVATALFVNAGDTVSVTATGSAGYGYEGRSGCVGYPTTHPDGSRYVGGKSCGPKTDPNAQLSGAAIGLLIGRVGSGPWFAVGASSDVKIRLDGTLTLAYNDVLGEYPDNTGSYSAVVTIVATGGGGSCQGDQCTQVVGGS